MKPSRDLGDRNPDKTWAGDYNNLRSVSDKAIERFKEHMQEQQQCASCQFAEELGNGFCFCILQDSHVLDEDSCEEWRAL